MAKKRKKSNIWLVMSFKARLQLAFAVFLMFGVLGPLMILMESKIQLVTWQFVAIQTLACGGLAASIILTIKKPWLMVFFIAVWLGIVMINSGSLAIMVDKGGLRTVLGQSTGVLSLEESSTKMSFPKELLDDIYTQRTKIGLLAIALLAIGYSRFIFVIRNEIKERSRLQTEVSIAREIQTSLLPSSEFTNQWCSISGVTIPATEVGGDLFDIVDLGNSKIAIAIADVSGHGVASGIMSAMTKSAFRSELHHDSTPEILLPRLNKTVFDLSNEKTFVTFGYVVFDYEKSIVTICTAGHPPILRRKADGTISHHRNLNPGLGMKGDIIFHQSQLEFSHGDSFLLYTDGAMEAANSKGEQFGEERISKTFENNSGAPSKTCASIVAEIKSFTGEETFTDDVTLVCITLSKS